MSVRCAHCGQAIADVAANSDGERFFHGACYALEYPPEHPEDWPKPLNPTTPDLPDGWREDA